MIRGAVSEEKKMILSYDDHDDVLEFVNSVEAPVLSQIGAACPDHLVHTKRVPLYIEWNPETQDVRKLVELIKSGVERFASEYHAYFTRNQQEGIKSLNQPHE